LTALVATGFSWLILPNATTYTIPAYTTNASILTFSIFMAPLAGLLSVGYVRAIAWADKSKPNGAKSWFAPLIVLTVLGFLSVSYPQLLGNGRDVSQLTFTGAIAPMTLLVLLILKPLATISCTASGIPGGLFTPSLTIGALLGALLGHGWEYVWPGTPLGLYAILGAGAILAATTQGPISTIVLMMELTGKDRTFILPLILSVVIATLIARTIEPRSIYEARLTDSEVQTRLRQRMGLNAH
jgi:H+/Cl- antiporter ClcA